MFRSRKTSQQGLPGTLVKVALGVALITLSAKIKTPFWPGLIHSRKACQSMR